MSNTITAIRTFDAPASTVYETWTSPSTIVAPVTAVEMDPRVGGRVRVSTGGDPAADLTGTFVRAERPSRLVYTWRWGDSEEETLVDVTFTDTGGSTLVEVRHSGFLDDESMSNHLNGWVTYFDGVGAAL